MVLNGFISVFQTLHSLNRVELYLWRFSHPVLQPGSFEFKGGSSHGCWCYQLSRLVRFLPVALVDFQFVDQLRQVIRRNVKGLES